MARELGGEAPLVETEASGKRLVREGEQGGSDDEDEKRIVFSGVKQKTQRQKIAEEIGTCVLIVVYAGVFWAYRTLSLYWSHIV